MECLHVARLQQVRNLFFLFFFLHVMAQYQLVTTIQLFFYKVYLHLELKDDRY